MAVQIRSSTDADFPKLIQLLNWEYRETYEFIPFNEEFLRSRISEGRVKIIIAEENGKFLGAAAYNDGHWGEEIDWMAVRSKLNRKMIEAVLVHEVENLVKRGSVFTAVDDGSPKIADWVERGYTPEGGLYQMITKLNGLKSLPEIPEATLVRSLKSGEEKAFIEAVNAVFGWERLRTGIIEEWKSDCPPFTEEWIHVAECGSKIVSVVASRPDAYYNKHFKGKRGYLGPAATLPEFRGKGLASALTLRAMNLLFDKGLDSAALYTSEQNAASLALLRRLGFWAGHLWKFMRKRLTQ